MNLEFLKMHGAGNDFIMVDNRIPVLENFTPHFVSHICRQHTGIGADGLILLENSHIADFRMRYFNSDGFESEMCANGSRCTCYFAYLLGIIDGKHTFEAGDGVHSGEIISENIVRVEVIYKQESVKHRFPVDFKLPNSISFTGFINTGVPHLVLSSDHVDSIDVEKIGRELRFHPFYSPEGTNINFVQLIKKGGSERIKVRTFERGVDAETLSCGSGVTASAICFYLQNHLESEIIAVETRGGDLQVVLSNDLKLIYLEGPVKIIFKGEYIEKEGIQ